ncbi:MAG: hypothetical protein JNK14_15955 [Chitinophagaceae bacterium]|nr:hypothetical protein [Chitinophagaceae bacterium]
MNGLFLSKRYYIIQAISATSYTGQRLNQDEMLVIYYQQIFYIISDMILIYGGNTYY